MEKNEICFIDSNFNELFRVPDGGQIIITYPNGAKQRATCKYISEQYMGIDGRCYHNRQWAELMENSGRTYAPAGTPEYSLKNIQADEFELMYAKEDESIDRGCIGVLRADFDKGNDFYSTWWPDNEKLETQEFKSEFDKVINYFRNEAETPILKNRLSMQNLCYSLKPTQSPTDKDVFGFKVITEKHTYYFRCNPRLGEYNLYAYCYNRMALDRFNNSRLVEQNIDKIERDAFFKTDYGVKEIYFNPDSAAGGQIVINEISKDSIKDALKYSKKPDAFFDFLGSQCTQYLIDIDTPEFKESFLDFINKEADICGVGKNAVKEILRHAGAEKKRFEPER